jgi:hypothetical protein
MSFKFVRDSPSFGQVDLGRSVVCLASYHIFLSTVDIVERREHEYFLPNSRYSELKAKPQSMYALVLLDLAHHHAVCV